MQRGESAIYITLAETRVELNAVAASHGWSMDGIHVEDIIPDENILHPEQQFTIFHPSKIEMGITAERILDAIEKHKPTRVVLDSLSELQLLAESPLRYRRQVLALKQYLAGKGCTTLFLDDRTALSGDLQVRSVAHGVITLEPINQDYGSERRRVRIVKYRGIAFRGGSHDYKIVTGALVLYPRLIAAHTRVLGERKRLSSGIPELDAVLAAAPAPAADANGMAVAVAGTRPKVLVVDDNRDAADSLQALFEMENCDVAIAYDGFQAVRATEQRMPDMIVMDLGMPKMDGYEAARLIRGKPGSQGVLMVALTGWGQSDAPTAATISAR